MNPLFRRLTWLLMVPLVLVPLTVLTTPAPVHAATCTPVASPSADVNDPNAAFDTGAHVIKTFNFARQQEGCDVSLSIDPAAYDAATPQMQEFMLVNAERQDRGLGALQLDATLLSQIDLNHSSEMVQYNYFAHNSPINEPGGNNGPFARLTVNPAINGHWDGLGENIAGGGPAGDAIYRFMYEDSASNWGHRQNILGYSGGTPGHSTWIGIGIATGGKFGFYSTLDFLDDAKSTKYTPPTTADTQPPTMNPPTIVDANTVQVTNVQDESDGTQAAAVTGVVFSIGSAVDPSGKFLTVVAKQDPATPATWTATLTATDLTTLHAVAVDGSGNFTDCMGNATSC
jgi:uncharacterized protein YkwD